MGHHPAPSVGRCYKICPPVVFPNGHDPYYDSPYYIHERELMGGPYGLVRAHSRMHTRAYHCTAHAASLTGRRAQHRTR